MRTKVWKLFMKVTGTERHIAAIPFGDLSNYPMCDIMWFMIRIKLMLTFSWYYRLAASTKKSRYRHIPCPFCRLKNWITRKYPRYYTCKKCGWVQLGKKKCYVCPMPKTLKKSLGL